MNEAMGHNSAIDAGHLRAFVERIEHIESEIKDLNEGKKEIYSEVRSVGYDARIVKKIVARRRMDRDRRIEEETLLDLYLSALGED